MTKKVAGLLIAGLFLASVVAAASSVMGSNFWFPGSTQVHGSNTVAIHKHVQLEIKIDGSPIVIPANIGITPTLYLDHSLDQFGVKYPPMAPLHTHDTDGIIHIESTTARDYTLGQFFDIWGVTMEELGSRTVSVNVDGKHVEDYWNHILSDGQKITMEIS